MPTPTLTLKRVRFFGKLFWNYRNVQDGLVAEDVDSLESGLVFNRTNPADVMWRDQRTVGSDALDDDLQLSGLPTSIFGVSVDFNSVRLLAIFNLSSTPGDDLYVGRGPSNTWSAPFGGDPGVQLVVQPGSPLVLGCNSGLAVLRGEADTLRVKYAGVSGSVSYSVVIVGDGVSLEPPAPLGILVDLLDEDGYLLLEEPAFAGADTVSLAEEPPEILPDLLGEDESLLMEETEFLGANVVSLAEESQA